MAIISTGTSSSGNANVDSSFNLMTNVPGYTSAGVSQGGGPAQGPTIQSENDAGTLTGSRSVSSPQTTQERRFRVGMDTLLFNETFNATAQNTSIWNYIFATLTNTLPGAGYLQIGTVQGTAATHGSIMKTFQHFPLIGTAPLVVDFSLGLFTATLVANEEVRIGFGNPTTAGTAPTDGAWLKLTTGGLFLELGYNGSVVPSSALATLASFTLGTQYTLRLVVGEKTVTAWRDGVLLGTLNRAAADSQPFIAGSLPIFIQKICTGVVSNTNVVRVGDVSAFLMDFQTVKSYEAQLATLGQNGNLGQNGHTQGKTSIYANNTAPTAVALTNTTAAFTGLGGQAAVLPTLAVSTDGILMAYQNPAPTINITGRNLLIYGVSIDSHVSVVFDAAAAVVYQASLQYGHNTVTLATAESASFTTATVHAPRVVPLGTINYGVALAAPARTLGNPIYRTFRVPIVVRPGEFVAIVLKLAVGSVVTTTGAVTFMVNYDAVWE